MDSNMFDELIALTSYHKKHCKLYADYVDSLFPSQPKCINDLPYLPVRAFKEFDLLSISKDEIFKTMYSSGTTGSQSKIYLDKRTVKEQSNGLTQSFKDYFGDQRYPMLIIDSQSTAKGQTARTAAVNGFSLYGKKHCFALDEHLKLKIDEVKEFLQKYQGQKIFVFGFTFIIYQYLIKALEETGQHLDLSSAFILHGGGWKKLAALNISDNSFKAQLNLVTRCKRVHNYYGMIEQTGSIYFECEHGRLHAPDNGGVLIRNFGSLEVNNYGEPGVIQVFSNIQKSYPGHSLLTEDTGVTSPSSNCPCGRKGDIIQIHGRLSQAEIRGCSDAV